MAYYNEDTDGAWDTLNHVVQALPAGSTSRRIIYAKGKLDWNRLTILRNMSDELFKFDNVGREGETYLVRSTCDNVKHLEPYNQVLPRG